MAESKVRLRSQKKVNVIMKKERALEKLPIVRGFQHSKLPLLKEVLGRVYERKDSEHLDFKEAIREVAKEVQNHWKDRNVYTVTLKSIRDKLTHFVSNYKKLLKRDESQLSSSSKYFQQCDSLNKEMNHLFDIFCEDEARRADEEKSCKIDMIDEDYKFLHSMRTDRAFPCGRVDTKFHREQEERARKDEKRLKLQTSNFSAVSGVQDEVSESTDKTDDDYCPESKKCRVLFQDMEPSSTITTRSQKQSLKGETADPTIIFPTVPIRKSLQMVNDDVYHTCAELDGEGFSLREIQIAMKVVGNRMFKQSWTIPKEKDRVSKYETEVTEETPTVVDSNTLPTRSAMRKKLKQVHGYSLGLISNEIMKADRDGAVITHSTDSTTRKKVGCFSPSGLHINKDTYLPLPTLQISSETTQNIAKGVETTFKMLEAASGHKSSDLYKTVDLHMTDSTAHNKGVADATAQLMERDKPAGQLFCNPHTALGFDRGFESVVNKIEVHMGMENIFKGFLLDVSIDQNNEAVSLTFVSWVLSLFGPDLIQKPWNYHEDFETHMKKQQKKTHLFHMKDGRFGLLSQCSAVICYHWEDFQNFLDGHDYITNKLACLVHDAMQFEYIPVILATIAAFGPHLIHPYFAKTKGRSTHSQLGEYFATLHNSLMTTEIDASFFEMLQPTFEGVSKQMFDSVKKNEYAGDILDAVSDTAMEHIEDCIMLANIVRKKMGDVLAQQRGSYYGFGGVAKEFYVFDQHENVDAAPTHNLEQERQCGGHDNRLQKKVNLQAVSRGNILKLTTNLCDQDGEKDKFRKMNSVVKAIEKVQSDWKCLQDELKESRLSAKETRTLHVENRKLGILEFLKSAGGPFTDASDIDRYLESEKDQTKAQNRLKKEVQYARDTSRSLPRTSHLFKIMSQDSTTKRRRTKTAVEFAVNLKSLLQRSSKQSEVTMTEFRLAVTKHSQWENNFLAT